MGGKFDKPLNVCVFREKREEWNRLGNDALQSAVHHQYKNIKQK